MSFKSPQDLLAALLQTIERDIVPLTRDGVSSGSKVFGAAILSSKTLKPLTVSTNNERASPLLHGEINCIQTFYTQTFPDPKDRPNPRDDCIFFATHEPCSLCLSGITWSGFKELYYLFTYEDSRDQFSIPYDIEILEEVFRVKADGESDEALQTRPLYNKTNKFFTAKSIENVVLGLEDIAERARWSEEVIRVKRLYNALGDEYQKNKQSGIETSSTWK
ncbi:cytidine deaminase-like protein [Fusarium tricinctum]|jgi:tRNA(Arg) A34 adenosine deaminase TadA|uniref:Cytidine deaminase-like protein n=1 Tax=Fusarium tricinctum TaxID=61284 RepID=A0A8K0W7C6_9HYPO|nr:cytidine deaminase-like protein [Fusarium tricinctum]